jgi:hypothetical protein
MKRFYFLLCFIILISACSKKSDKVILNNTLSEVKNNNDETSPGPYNGIWLDINKNGEIDSSHFMIIEIIKGNALIIDLQITKKEIIKNHFYASFKENKIIYEASPLSFQYEYFKASDLKEKPLFFKSNDSVLKVTQAVFLPEAGENSTYSGYYKKLNDENVQKLLDVLQN